MARPLHRTRQQFLQVGCADHGCFVDDDHGAPIDSQVVVFDQRERLGHRQPAVAGLFLQRLVDGFAGGGKNEDLLAGAVRGGAQRFERVCFAGAGGRLQRLHQERRCGDVADGAFLVGGEVTQVLGAHIEATAVVGLVDHVEDPLFLEQDGVDGVLFVAFAVVGFARIADAHRDLVDDLLDERARITGRVDR